MPRCVQECPGVFRALRYTYSCISRSVSRCVQVCSRVFTWVAQKVNERLRQKRPRGPKVKRGRSEHGVRTMMTAIKMVAIESPRPGVSRCAQVCSGVPRCVGWLGGL